MTGRSESMKRASIEVSGVGSGFGPEMGDMLVRIESALQRAESAAERIGQRHKGLRLAARDTLAGLDRLIQAERRKSNG